jgi:putative hemolysin
VACAHQRGIVHRDLKPHNVLLSEDRTPKITDFGLAKRVEGGGELTATGAVVGTPSYMAPEQAGGKGKEVGPAADVYALGAILYEMLTGRPPFQGPTALDTLLQVVGNEPVAVRVLQPKVPRDLETICLKCLQKEPRKRYGSAEELAEDLRRFQAGEPITARPVGVAERVAKWVKRRPAVAALLALVLLLTAVGLGGIAWAYGEALRERNNAQTEATNARLAEKKTQDQLQETERALANSKVVLADAFWRAGKVALARDRLDEVPDELRLWEWRYLKRTTTGGLFTLYGDTEPVWSVCFSPDGQRLASGGDTVRVWDARTGKHLLALQHTDTVYRVCFSPDGQRLATGSDDNTAKVWDAHTGQPLLALKGHTNGMTSVCFSPDGQRLACGSGYRLSPLGKPGEVTVWDARTGQEVLALKGHTDQVLSVCFSPDGQRLATGGWNAFHRDRPGEVKVWDARTGKHLLALKGHTREVLSVCFSPDGQRLASGSADGTAKLWDARSGQFLLSLQAHTGEVAGVCFSPDGQRLATGGGNPASLVNPGEVKVRDVSMSTKGQQAGGQQLLALEGYTGPVNSVSFSADGQRLASGSGR